MSDPLIVAYAADNRVIPPASIDQIVLVPDGEYQLARVRRGHRIVDIIVEERGVHRKDSTGSCHSDRSWGNALWSRRYNSPRPPQLIPKCPKPEVLIVTGPEKKQVSAGHT